jgi:SpoIIAA-like
MAQTTAPDRPTGPQQAPGQTLSRSRSLTLRSSPQPVQSSGMWDFQIKVLQWPQERNFVIVIVRGSLDTWGVEQIFREITERTRSLAHYKVLIDLVDATLYMLEPLQVRAYVNELTPDWRSRARQIALVSPSGWLEHQKLQMLASTLFEAVSSVRVFRDSQAATAWLSDT